MNRRSFSTSLLLGPALSKRKDVRYGVDGLHLRRAETDSHKNANAWQVVRNGGSAEVAEVLELDRKSSQETFPETDFKPAISNPQLPHFRKDFEERAAIMEFDGGLSRDEAESQAKKEETS